MKKPISFLFLFLVCMLSIGQEIKTKKLQVKIRNATSGLGIDGVKISTQDGTFNILTEKTSYEMIRIPKGTDKLVFQHQDYFNKTVSFKPKAKGVKVLLTPLLLDSNDLPLLKNVITFAPFILARGRLEFIYERYILKKQSVGVILRWYFKGEDINAYNQYTAYQASPFYRYYIKRNKSYGTYMQAKLMIAYFDFSKILYEWDKDYEYSEDRFWTGGAGFAIGYNDVLGNSKHVIIDMQVGMQIFPLLYPAYKYYQGRDFSSRQLWWYVGGPGSVIEMRISFGGIF